MKEDDLDELGNGVEKVVHLPGVQGPCWGSAAGSSSKPMSGVTVSPVPLVLTCVPSSVPVSHRASGPWLAEKGLRSTPCPPAIPWMKARKCHMPWVPLMNFSSSHWSALCQFSSFAVRECRAWHQGVPGARGPPSLPDPTSTLQPPVTGCWRAAVL